MNHLEDQDAREQVARAETLLADLETLLDGQAKTTAIEAVQALLELYGEGLARIVGYVADAGDGAVQLALADDELVSHLLLLHGLHPVAVETRVLQALEEVRPYLASHGGDVELLGINQGVVQLRLLGSCHGCAASTTTLQLAVEQAIYKIAPDVLNIEADGQVAPEDGHAPPSGVPLGFIPLSSLEVKSSG